MSTVSGGGYAGGGLSSLALHPETEFEWKSSHVLRAGLWSQIQLLLGRIVIAD
jgi:hypothetical protein